MGMTVRRTVRLPVPLDERLSAYCEASGAVLISEGASVAYLSRVLGHASPAITLNIYAHAFARVEHDDRTRERMEAAFGGLLG